MKKFSQLTIIKPVIAEIQGKLGELSAALASAKNGEEAVKVCFEEFKYSDELQTYMTIASIRHTIDTLDKEYEELNDLYDEISPLIQNEMQKFYHLILTSKFKKELIASLGQHFLDMAALSEKTFKPEIIEDLQEENKLVSQYVKLKSSAQIEYKGEKYTLAQLAKFLQSSSREERKITNKLCDDFYEEHDAEFGKIYGDLVLVRSRIAKKLGYDNFIQLGYDRLGRIGYGPKEVKNYRQQVLKDIVPLSNKLFARQMERLGFEDSHYYDYKLKFASGNCAPIGDEKYMVKAAKKMYKQISPITKKIFNFMIKHELFDLTAKKGKAGGGYMTYIPLHSCAFIFSNFNGTSGDVDVLTHEFGHALQGFLSAGETIPEYRSPTMEMCEVHSMSMEFFAYPYMDLFFGKDEKKYRFTHLSSAINFIPYGVAVDEFQHYVYENPTETPTARKLAWREIEKKYLPHLQYGVDSPFLEQGGFWYRQSHIFEVPFYYIDYTIAQVLAFEFFVLIQKDKDQAFEKYLSLDKLGGKKPFDELLKTVELRSPFEKGTIALITPTLEEYLNSFDDKAL